MRYVCVPTSYIRVYAYCVIQSMRTTIMYAYNNYVRVQQICMRTIIMYAYNNYVCIQQLCTRTTIMYAYNNYYVRVQQLLCTRTTITYAYNNVCVKRCTCAHIRVHAQAHPRTFFFIFRGNSLEKCIAPS